MNKYGKIIIVVLVTIVGIAAAFEHKGNTPEPEAIISQNSENSAKLPHLVDLGASTCIPCKMMKPILDDLTENYNEHFKVTFIDVWKNPDEGKKYNIESIPTQIFYDADGNELFRHEGFYSKEDILGKWKELGIEIEKDAAAVPTFGADDPKKVTVEKLYPNLAASVLTYAKAAELPEGILLKAEGGIEISLSDLEKAISSQPLQVQPKLKKNAFFVLEQEATGKLLEYIAKKEIKAASDMGDDQLIGAYIEKITEDIAATEKEQRVFYDANPQFFPGVPFEKVQPQIAQYLAREKKQHFVENHVRSLGQKITIEVSSGWTADRARLAKDNPLHKARYNGKHTIVVFNATSPCCPDEVGPVVETVGKQFGSRLNTVSINPNMEPILAARYNVSGNPFLIFYDAKGQEVFRNEGALSKEQILAKLAEIGLK